MTGDCFNFSDDGTTTGGFDDVVLVGLGDVFYDEYSELKLPILIDTAIKPAVVKIKVDIKKFFKSFD